MKNGKQFATLPTATVTPIRLCVFQATRRPAQAVRTIATPFFGNMTIDGRLGQAHADVMECVMRLAEPGRHRVRDGRLEVIVDPHRLRRMLAGGEGKYSAEQLGALERDLLRAILTIETPTIKSRGHIVEQIVESKLTATDPRKWSGEGERPLQKWVFPREWTAIIRNDIGRWYDPTPLCRIDRGSVAAIARHILTHRHQPNGGWKLAGLMEAAGVERRSDKVRCEMRECIDALEEMGIRIEGDRVFMSAPAPESDKNVRTRPSVVRTRPRK